MRAGNLEIGICDDSPEDLRRIQRAFRRSAKILGEKDISLYLYSNGKSLYDDSKNRKFSLVFLDWEMPEMDGFDLAGRLYIENPELKVCLYPIMKISYLTLMSILRCGLCGKVCWSGT